MKTIFGVQRQTVQDIARENCHDSAIMELCKDHNFLGVTER